MLKDSYNSQIKYAQLEQKIDKLASIVSFLSNNNDVKALSQITDIKIDIKDLESRIEANKLKITYIEESINDIKQSLNSVRSLQFKTEQQQKKDLGVVWKKLQQIKDELHKVKVQLTQNDGQTNQCYISIAKLETELNKLHINGDNFVQEKDQAIKMQEAQNHIKSMFYKILVGSIITIGLFILSWIGTKYWNAILNDIIDKSNSNVQIEYKQKVDIITETQSGNKKSMKKR